eukprot:UN05206
MLMMWQIECLISRTEPPCASAGRFVHWSLASTFCSRCVQSLPTAAVMASLPASAFTFTQTSYVTVSTPSAALTSSMRACQYMRARRRSDAVSLFSPVASCRPPCAHRRKGGNSD